jgi:hypothetical protein
VLLLLDFGHGKLTIFHLTLRYEARFICQVFHNLSTILAFLIKINGACKMAYSAGVRNHDLSGRLVVFDVLSMSKILFRARNHFKILFLTISY